jgi:hypothetical protein
MARQGTSRARRTLVQTDRAFWCIHEHLEAMVFLGLPTLAALLLAGLALVALWRAWELPGWLNFLLATVPIPLLALLIFTVLPLPAAVFAWRRAVGETATVGECYVWCRRRGSRLLSVVARLALLWLVSLMLLGLPFFWIWPRTCLAPLVALFEDQPRIFHRSRRILREDVAVYLIGGLYLAMALVLAGLVFTPRLVFGTPVVGAHVLEAGWRQLIIEYLWIFEVVSVAMLLTALAMSWWISLTLLYHEIRWVREGEELRRRIARLRGQLVG